MQAVTGRCGSLSPLRLALPTLPPCTNSSVTSGIGASSIMVPVQTTNAEFVARNSYLRKLASCSLYRRCGRTRWCTFAIHHGLTLVASGPIFSTSTSGLCQRTLRPKQIHFCQQSPLRPFGCTCCIKQVFEMKACQVLHSKWVSL